MAEDQSNLAGEEKESVLSKARKAVIPSGPKNLAEPEKELRFTRARQGALFFLLSALCFGGGMAYIATRYVWDEPFLPLLWSLTVSLPLTFLFLRLGLRCMRHAYLILSPLGIEIFPFFRPQKNLQIIYWSEVDDAEIDTEKETLIIHFNTEKSSGIVASIKPILLARRPLLIRAIEGTMEKQRAQKSSVK